MSEGQRRRLPALLSSSKRSWGAASRFCIGSLKIRLIRPLLSEENPPSLCLQTPIHLSYPMHGSETWKFSHFSRNILTSFFPSSSPSFPIVDEPLGLYSAHRCLIEKKLQPNTVPYRKAAFHVGIKYQLHKKSCSALITLMKNHPINQVSNQLISHKKVETVILSINS